MPHIVRCSKLPTRVNVQARKQHLAAHPEARNGCCNFQPRALSKVAASGTARRFMAQSRGFNVTRLPSKQRGV
ncbi:MULTISPECIES: hypothetical protein [unclassified Diaminobutyricimonas]|uniref:hypothetical protein n=1 Tax=unclassified Diaminobutyricimonas TaxID=2643261 RepID=UPI0012F4952C|nr:MULTISPECIES: hypothetical protein [unclassified Diaminobutyricimonas]